MSSKVNDRVEGNAGPSDFELVELA
jgi:hypothetical protein